MFQGKGSTEEILWAYVKQLHTNADWLQNIYRPWVISEYKKKTHKTQPPLHYRQ